MMEEYSGWKPSWTSGESAWEGHFEFARWIVQKQKPKKLVELGVLFGDSLMAFAESAGTSCHLFGIDSFSGDSFVSVDIPDLFDTVTERFRPYTNVRIIRMSFLEASCLFPNNTVDLLHIDGDHAYESVKQDYESWLPRMSENGIILFHDTNMRNDNFGVWRLWEEIRNTKPSVEFLHSSGLGVLFLGKSLSITDFLKDCPDYVVLGPGPVLETTEKSTLVDLGL